MSYGQSGLRGPRRKFEALNLKKESHAVCIGVYAFNQQREHCPLGRLIEVIRLEGVTNIDDLEPQPQLLQLETMNQADYQTMWEGVLSEDWQGVAEGFIESNHNPEDREVHSQQYQAELQTQLDTCIDSIEPPAPPLSSCSVQ